MPPSTKSQKDDRWRELFGGTHRRRTHKKRYQDRRDDRDRRERRGGKKGCKRSKRRR